METLTISRLIAKNLVWIQKCFTREKRETNKKKTHTDFVGIYIQILLMWGNMVFVENGVSPP